MEHKWKWILENISTDRDARYMDPFEGTNISANETCNRINRMTHTHTAKWKVCKLNISAIIFLCHFSRKQCNGKRRDKQVATTQTSNSICQTIFGGTLSDSLVVFAKHCSCIFHVKRVHFIGAMGHRTSPIDWWQFSSNLKKKRRVWKWWKVGVGRGGKVQFSSIFPSVNCFTISNCIKRYDSSRYYCLQRDTPGRHIFLWSRRIAILRYVLCARCRCRRRRSRITTALNSCMRRGPCNGVRFGHFVAQSVQRMSAENHWENLRHLEYRCLMWPNCFRIVDFTGIHACSALHVHVCVSKM